MIHAIRWRALWLARRLAHLYPTDHTTPDQRRGMHYLWWDGILASVSGAFHAEFVVLYMLALGATTATVGLRATIHSAAALAAPLIGAWLVARSGRRKLWVLLGPGGVARVSLLLTAAIPFLFRGEAAVAAFLALFALQAFAGTVGMPAANALLGDVVPLPIRGRFLGTSMMSNNLATILVLPLTGLLIARIGGLGGYQVIWLLAALAGFGATMLYARIPEPVEEHAGSLATRVSLADSWGAFLRDRQFMRFCAIGFVWTFGIQLSGPFFTVHMVETLGFTADTIAYIATATVLVNVVALRVAGELVDKRGAARMTAVAMLLVPLMPLFWILARTPFQVGLVRAYGFVAWAGFHVATLPLVLMLAPARHRPQYLAIYNTVNGVANVIAPLPAAWIYATWGFNANLVLSSAGRLAGGLMFLWMYHSGVFQSREAQATWREATLAD